MCVERGGREKGREGERTRERKRERERERERESETKIESGHEPPRRKWSSKEYLLAEGGESEGREGGGDVSWSQR